jgi:hypothetical protein
MDLDERTVKQRAAEPAAPIAWRIVPLPQASGAVHRSVALIGADGAEMPVLLSSKTERGIRQQMRAHPRYRDLPERVFTPDQALVATVRAHSLSGPYTVLAGTGLALRSAGEEWPAPLPNLLTEGSDGE